MSEYKRLTGKSIGSFQYCLKDHKPKVGEFNDYDTFFDYSMAIKRLGELEDKIENGTLVETPCKVGDTVYFVPQSDVIEVGYVKGISIQNDGIWIACHYASGLSYWHSYKYENLYFNYAEAEAKLKELQEYEK